VLSDVFRAKKNKEIVKSTKDLTSKGSLGLERHYEKKRTRKFSVIICILNTQKGRIAGTISAYEKTYRSVVSTLKFPCLEGN